MHLGNKKPVIKTGEDGEVMMLDMVCYYREYLGKDPGNGSKAEQEHSVLKVVGARHDSEITSLNGMNIYVKRLSEESARQESPVPLKDTRLLDVKLGQLPSWIAVRDFTPSGLTGAVRRGYDRYLNKYINVKKGSIGGVAMVLFGYVVVSYIWNYEHLKHDRWRKYH
ncbi:ATP synthase subunit f, mitochondrial-like [Mauremys mutica]|uniref:ATP synthase subunit f, mitochondrial-like n=1 Tax=Mauremys mutica TaxID=74926 RepID=UPI001D16CE45|nr:ATP synthase subunit f, mitochondrial-like [Mauremys mutica]